MTQSNERHEPTFNATKAPASTKGKGSGNGRPPGGKRPKAKRKLGWLRYTLYSFAALFLIICCAVGGYVWWLSQSLPGVGELKNYTPPITTRVYAGDGTVLGEYARERRLFVPISFIPNKVRDAFISAEDRNFYHHIGVDPIGIMRAAIKDVGLVARGRRPQGASTITQQVARNFLLNSDVRMARKIREALLAIKIDSTYSKDKVLELYLNEINLGQNSYGVAAAALNYFGKSLDQLDIAQCAFLAALPKAPSHYDPRFHLQAATTRRNWVIGQMLENGYITKAEAQAAKAEPLDARHRRLGSQTKDANYFVEEIRRKLYARYGQKKLYEGGLQVRSTLNTRLQNAAATALRHGLAAYDHRHGWRGAKKNIPLDGNWMAALKKLGNHSGIKSWHRAVVLQFIGSNTKIGFADGTRGTIPLKALAWARKPYKNASVGPSPTKPQQVFKTGDVIYVKKIDPKQYGKDSYGLRQIPEVNGAIVVMDPHTGRVLALSGGFSFASSEFDRAMQAKRQMGSVFKPFVYAAALDNGYTPADKVLDGPFCASQGPDLPLWCPANYENDFMGMTTLRRGLEHSRNLMTVRLAQDVGMDKIAPLAERFGLYKKLDPLLANALGSTGTTLLKVVTGYAEFVNGGKKITPSLIDRVQNRYGKTIWRHDQRDCPACNAKWQDQEEPMLEDTRQQILDPTTAYQIVYLLQGVVQQGTGVTVSRVGKPLAGKTGTSNDARDAWFVGFSPDLVAGVYVGFDIPRTLGKHEQGASAAAPIFRDFMADALKGKDGKDFRVPEGIEFATVDHITGKPVPAGSPDSIYEAFKSGTAPNDPDAPPQKLLGGSTPADMDPSLLGANGKTNLPGQTAPAKKVDEGTGGLY